MGYSIHIQREESISLEEWEKAISKISGIKLDTEPMVAVNPKTGESISIPAEKGDVAVLFEHKGFLGFGKKQLWEKCIYFTNGRATFNATNDIENTNNPIHRAVASIAKSLSASIVGDEGEIYSW